jgi:CheY-like chemotaxis protein
LDEEAETKVLIVEDEEDVADTFRMWLEDSYGVSVAHSGSEALDKLERVEVDVVLLDRLMPGLSGDEVLERIEKEGFDCRVAMVTAVEPDFDIVEMGFDEYITKPSSPEELRETVDELLERRKRSRQLQEYASLRVKQAALRTEKTEDREFARRAERGPLRRGVPDRSQGHRGRVLGCPGPTRLHRTLSVARPITFASSFVRVVRDPRGVGGRPQVTEGVDVVREFGEALVLPHVVSRRCLAVPQVV